ncbi:MAG: poly(R)-hydroxyalkanoic acid synthase subunit PhaE [Gammaproteobacteria bacterium]
MQTPPLSAVFDQWQKYQKSYLDAWKSMAESSISANPAGNPWTDALERWWLSLSEQSVPAGSKDLFSTLIEQGKTFFNMASSINGSLKDAMNIRSTGGDWEKVIARTFDGLRGTLAAGSSSFPVEMWRKFIIEQFQSPGDLIPDFVKKFQDTEHLLLNMPAVGQSREKQEQLQKLTREISDYRVACGEFIEVQTKIGNLAVDLLQDEIKEMFSKGEYPESYRAIYDLWVDCYEEVYADAVMQPEYNKAYSDMVNSLMNLTVTYRGLQDDALEASGMPSRRELDTLYKRFQEERRERFKMRAEIASLKEQIKQIGEGSSAPSEATTQSPATTEAKSEPATPPRRRTSTRRTTVAAEKSTIPSSTK